MYRICSHRLAMLTPVCLTPRLDLGPAASRVTSFLHVRVAGGPVHSVSSLSNAYYKFPQLIRIVFQERKVCLDITSRLE